MDRSSNLKYWLVELGDLYYAGGLKRISPLKDAFSLEFVSDESLAFPFIEEVFASNIAAKCSGLVIEREMTLEEYPVYYERHNNYINSEEEWNNEQMHAIIDDLTRRNE